VLCDGRTARIQPVAFGLEQVRPFERTNILDKLEFLVGSTVGDTFHALIAVRSGFWSFVEVPGRDDHAGVA